MIRIILWTLYRRRGSYWLALTSREEGKSISEVTRTLIDEALVAHQSATWAAREIALIDLRALRESIQGTHGMITVDLVGEARDEREQERPRP